MSDAVDVLVVGAGSAGSTAAVAAARTGASTLLVDRFGFLGGTSTAVLDTFYAFYTPGSAPKKVVAGIPDEVVGRLVERGMAFERPNTYGAGTGVTYDPESLKRVWDELVADAGARTLLHAFAFAAEAADGRVVSVDVAAKGGVRRIRPRVLVDASGDADVCALAGAPFEAPGDDVQSLSTVFRIANVDVARAESVPKQELWSLMRAARDSGRYSLTRIEGSIHRTPHDGVMMALMTRVRRVDATDADQLSAAEREGRRQAHEYFRFLRDEVPGYERAVLLSTSPAIGVRESRRIVGEHVLTADEILSATQFDDQIARCGAPIEEHHAGDDTRWVYLEEGATYGIPYRALQPRDLDNVVVAGRCFSATHEAHASARSMATCMAMGQAAGTAAALADEPKRLDPERLRTRLREDGADLGD
ncbi:MAG TPA: FAD-dependent oxidoreductase [Gaiellaceae bacterium]|jgi:hypothetical protein